MESVCLVVMGCPKNEVEGEHIAGLLREAGYRITADLSTTDIAVVHTCSFIGDARDESSRIIRELSAMKRAGTLKKLVVAGCLVQDEGTAITAQFPHVDVFTGTGQLHRLPELIAGTGGFFAGKPGGFLESSAPRLLSSSLPVAYLRIAEGCNHRCSFCVIPRLRGPYRSRSRVSILQEARELAANGVKELILIAQDTTVYGRDRSGKEQLSGLVRGLERIDDIRWIRLMYAYPNTVTPALLAAMRESAKVCRYLDIPLQHASDRVLRRMNRPLQVRRTLERIVDALPDIALRTAFIVGFPGETAADFKELLRLVEEGWFTHAGVFEYSPHKDSRASALDGQVSPALKAERRHALMVAQKKVVERHRRLLRDTVTEVLVEEYIADGKWRGRTVFQAPEIDGRVIVAGTSKRGAFVNARITGGRGYDLEGIILNGKNYESGK